MFWPRKGERFPLIDYLYMFQLCGSHQLGLRVMQSYDCDDICLSAHAAKPVYLLDPPEPGHEPVQNVACVSSLYM